MDDETLTAVSEILVKHCPTVLSNQFLLFLTRERLTTGSINSLMNCVLVKKRRSNPDETTAKTLTRLLKPNDDIEHVSCTASYNEELDLVKVCRQCKNVKNVTEQDVDSVSGDTKSLAKFVINGLQLKEGNMLIAIVLVSKIARHWYRLHPQVLGEYVKKKANSETLPLLNFTDMDVEGHNLNHAQWFNPSEQRWINTWMADDTMPLILNKDSLMILETTQSDKDLQCVMGQLVGTWKSLRTNTAKLIIFFTSVTRQHFAFWICCSCANLQFIIT